ncbi:MAG: peptidase domain-containing ABC transporter [bacterium]|nr:peptidase domain-containing ABC transporter [bacterium]
MAAAIPVICQSSATDCGAACLAMILGAFGRHVPVEDLRTSMGPARDGVSAQAIIATAAGYGLDGRGVALDLDELPHLPRASVLHWEFRHFVVFDRVRRGRVRIIDPGVGVQELTMAEFGRRFTGVAIVFERGTDFHPGGQARRPVHERIRRFITDSGLLGRVLGASALMQLFGLGLPVLTGALVDDVVQSADLHLWRALGAGAALLVAMNFLTALVRSHLLLQLRVRLDATLTTEFLSHLLSLPFAFFQARTAGDLMMRLNSNAVIREMITSVAIAGALDGILAAGYLVGLLAVAPQLAGIAALLAAIRVAVILAARGRIRELTRESLAREAASQSYQVQIFGGITSLKAAGVEERALERWRRLFIDVLNVQVQRGRVDALVQAALGALGYASPLVILLAGGYLVLQGNLTLGTMLASSALASGFLAPVGSLAGLFLQLQELGGYLDRLDDVLSAAPEAEPGQAESPQLRGRIELREVSFRYQPGSPLVVREVSLVIEPGEMVAIVGPSAAGKSTLAHLMLGLYRPTTGAVLFDDRDIAQLGPRSLRRQIGVVPQHPYIFAGSIRENIALAQPDSGLDDVAAAARLAQIDADVGAMPLGYETPVSEAGQGLSGGQRQRLALARALLGGPAVLLLDEATSALDAPTEAAVHDALQALRCTRIVIAHRLSTIRRATRIVVLEAGIVVESGSHDALVEQGGAYARLLGAQFGGSESRVEDVSS